MGIQLVSFYVRNLRSAHPHDENGIWRRRAGIQIQECLVILHHPRPSIPQRSTTTGRSGTQRHFHCTLRWRLKLTEKAPQMLSMPSSASCPPQGFWTLTFPGGFVSRVMDGEDTVPVRAADAGFMEAKVTVGEHVTAGQTLAFITDSYRGTATGTYCTEAGIVASFTMPPWFIRIPRSSSSCGSWGILLK